MRERVGRGERGGGGRLNGRGSSESNNTDMLGLTFSMLLLLPIQRIIIFVIINAFCKRFDVQIASQHTITQIHRRFEALLSIKRPSDFQNYGEAATDTLSLPGDKIERGMGIHQTVEDTVLAKTVATITFSGFKKRNRRTCKIFTQRVKKL